MGLKVQFYPDGDNGPVKEYLEALRINPQRHKAHGKLQFDLAVLQAEGFMSRFLDIRRVTGVPGSVWELRRPFQGIAYRIYFCVKKAEAWLIHYLEKETKKIPKPDLELIRRRSRDVLEKL